MAYPKSFSAYPLFGGTQRPFALKAFRKVEVRPSGVCYLSHRPLRQAQWPDVRTRIFYVGSCLAGR